MLHDFNDFLRVNIPSTVKNHKIKSQRFTLNRPTHDDYKEIDEFEQFMARNSRKNKHWRTFASDSNEYFKVFYIWMVLSRSWHRLHQIGSSLDIKQIKIRKSCF